jgi:hypothetical protein
MAWAIGDQAWWTDAEATRGSMREIAKPSLYDREVIQAIALHLPSVGFDSFRAGGRQR